MFLFEVTFPFTKTNPVAKTVVYVCVCARARVFVCVYMFPAIMNNPVAKTVADARARVCVYVVSAIMSHPVAKTVVYVCVCVRGSCHNESSSS